MGNGRMGQSFSVWIKPISTVVRFVRVRLAATWGCYVRSSGRYVHVQTLALQLPTLHHQRLRRWRQSERRRESPDFRYFPGGFCYGSGLSVLGNFNLWVVGGVGADRKLKEKWKVKKLLVKLLPYSDEKRSVRLYV